MPPPGLSDCSTMGSSMAACGNLPWVVGCWGQPTPPWASSGLQRDSALLLKQLLHFFCTGLDVFRAVLLIVFHCFLPAAAVKQFFLNLLSRVTTSFGSALVSDWSFLEQLLTPHRGYTCSPLLLKSCYLNLIHQCSLSIPSLVVSGGHYVLSLTLCGSSLSCMAMMISTSEYQHSTNEQQQ